MIQPTSPTYPIITCRSRSHFRKGGDDGEEAGGNAFRPELDVLGLCCEARGERDTRCVCGCRFVLEATMHCNGSPCEQIYERWIPGKCEATRRR